MTTADIQTIINALLAFATIVVPIVIAFLGKAAYQLISAHASGQQQVLLSQLALAAVSAAEQAFKGQPGAPRFAQADAFLVASLPKRVKLTPEQRRALIEGSVRSLNAGVIALAPNTAALLTPEMASAAPGVDVQTITDNAASAASTAIQAQVPGAVQSALQTLLAPLAPLISILGAFGTATSNAPAPVAAVQQTPATAQDNALHLVDPTTGEVQGIVTPVDPDAASVPTTMTKASKTKTAPGADVTAPDSSVVPAQG